MKVKNIIEDVNDEQDVMNHDCVKKLERLEALMTEMLQEKKNLKLDKSSNKLKLMEELINDITEEMVATVQAHLAEVSAIEKLEQMKQLIRQLAKEGDDETLEKLNDVEEIIVEIQDASKSTINEVKVGK